MNRVTGALVGVLLASCVGKASVEAALVLDVIEFDGPELGPGDLGSVEVKDNVVPPVWQHDLTDESGAAVAAITDGLLTVTYRKTEGVEIWTLFGDGIALGTLTPSEAIVTSSFSLSLAALEALRADGKLDIQPRETTSGIDRFRLYRSELSGTYPDERGGESGSMLAPEPSCLWLFGLALLMMWLVRSNPFTSERF